MSKHSIVTDQGLGKSYQTMRKTLSHGIPIEDLYGTEYNKLVLKPGIWYRLHNPQNIDIEIELYPTLHNRKGFYYLEADAGVMNGNTIVLPPDVSWAGGSQPSLGSGFSLQISDGIAKDMNTGGSGSTGYPVENMGKYGAPFFLGLVKGIYSELPEYKEAIDGRQVFKDNLTFTFEEFEQVREDHTLGKYGDWENILSSHLVGTLKFSCFDCNIDYNYGTNVYYGLIYDITIDFNAETVSLKYRNIEPNIIYYFPRHGLWLRIVGESDNFLPVVVNVERYYPREPFQISTKDMDAVVPRVNEYIRTRNMENYLGIDATIINATPGGNLIDVCGRFRVDVTPYRIVLNDCSLADNNPPLVLRHTYEYHILDRVLSYIDVTFTTTEQADR